MRASPTRADHLRGALTDLGQWIRAGRTVGALTPVFLRQHRFAELTLPVGEQEERLHSRQYGIFG